MGPIRSVLLASAVLSAPSAWAYAGELHERPGILTIELAANKASYRVGEAIELRVTIVNRTGRAYGVALYPPYGLCRLVIRDGSGKPMHSRGQRGFVDWKWSALNVPAFGKVVVKYAAAESHHAVKEWFDVRYWGYDLNRPGRYAIRAIPQLEVFPRQRNGTRAGPAFTTAATDASNVVYVTVVV